jgi:hypothetical protein
VRLTSSPIAKNVAGPGAIGVGPMHAPWDSA